ncbi:MAG: glycerol-3-phosphate 1-O-acyltransferase PlsY [Flavobacteriales bacterium]|nr:glycerol-3-phosphate 1-O-acyltransferase PlsY [Bacteroidota bacterium]MCB9239524.1 glycerol-3-phosphate 1-O-acyltransferase PlsY [Flavobacteriales bacterium]
MTLELIGIIIGAYLLGSIPSAVLVGKAFHGIDIREHGSNSAGATNTFRVLGKKSGTLVLAMDIIKGLTAVNLAFLVDDYGVFERLMNLKLTLGLVAVFGHIYPVFAGFKGGKGIATLLGMVIALHGYLALGVLAVFLIVQLLTNMVSAGSITAAMSFSIFVWLIFGYSEPVLLIFGLMVSILVMYTHRTNIARIINGTEKKIYLFKRKNDQVHEHG